MAKLVDLNIPYHYHPRSYQIPFWENTAKKKRACIVWHRRAGKEKTCWNFMVKEAFKRVGNYYYIFPDAKMARRILWDGKDKEGYKTLDHIPEPLRVGINNSEMKVTLRNGSLILVLGSHDIDSLRGPNPVGIVFSEYAEQSPKAWQVMSPILAENDGWAIFNFTPKGQNHACDLYNMAQVNPNWFCQLLTVNDTRREDGRRVITDEMIQEERLNGMSEDMIQQEYYCSFTMGIDGSYYAKYIQASKDEQRVGKVPYDKQKRVYTAWDIGYGDSTAIIFYQICGKEIHIIDYYENHGEGLSHYAKLLHDKPYIYADHFAPHDIDSHEFSSGLSPKEVGLDLGIKFTSLPTLKVSIESGIEAARGIFPRIWLDSTSCSRLLKCLENYRKEFDEKYQTYKARPVHDWASHGADAFRYMALAIRLYVDRINDGVTDKEADALFSKYNPVFV